MPLSHDRAPCGALCRGACGANCDEDSCTVTTGETCTTWDCGSHAACREHDACYDACNRSYGCNAVATFLCKHAPPDGCDEICLAAHGTTCFSWARGFGPFDQQLEFEHCGPDTPCEGLMYFTVEDGVVTECGVAHSNCPEGAAYNVRCSPPTDGAISCECLVNGERQGGCVTAASPPPDPAWCSGVSYGDCCGFAP